MSKESRERIKAWAGHDVNIVSAEAPTTPDLIERAEVLRVLQGYAEAAWEEGTATLASGDSVTGSAIHASAGLIEEIIKDIRAIPQAEPAPQTQGQEI